MQPFAAAAFDSAPGTSPPAASGNHYSPSGSSTPSPAVSQERAKIAGAASGSESGFLTIREVAAVLRVSESTIRNAIGSGRLRAFRFGNRGGSIRIGRADLEDYMALCATAARRSVRNSSRSGGSLFKNLDGSRLLAAWRQQGVLDGQQGERSGPSSGKGSV
jgi:excisionase family DNA binding protein